MVADLCHFMLPGTPQKCVCFSPGNSQSKYVYYGGWYMPFRVFGSSPRKAKEGEDTKPCLFVVTSTNAFRGEDTINKQRVTTRKNSILPADMKFSTKKFSCLRLLKCRYFALHISCFRIFAPKVELTTIRQKAFRLSGRRHENTKWHKWATIYSKHTSKVLKWHNYKIFQQQSL